MINSTSIDKGVKITNRVYQTKHPITQKIINIVANMDYDLFIHRDENLDKSQAIFTIILTICSADIRYVEESLQSVFGQIYQNTEVILINNGANKLIAELIWKYFQNHKNAKLIRTKKNLYDPAAKVLASPIAHLWNAGLFCSVGDFIYFMSYDDKLSPNYTQEMVQLFIENPNCCTAAPLIASINDESEINTSISTVFKNNNQRERYTDGILLAQSYMRGENKIAFPGGLMAIKSTLVLDCGGFDNHNDLSQLFKFAICGVSGFSSVAILYWRHHPNQTNKIQTKMGLIYYQALKEFNQVYEMRNFHLQVAGASFAEEYEYYINKLSIERTITAFRNSYNFSFISGLKALSRILIECPFKIQAIAIKHYLKDFPNYIRRIKIARAIYHKFFKMTQ